MTKKIQAIDLFCGAGGLTKGLSLSGVSVKVGVDTDQHCEYPYSENNEAVFLKKSVADIKKQDLIGYIDSDAPLLLAGCAPCQTFSKYNQKASSDDDRWWLIKEFGRLVVEMSPDYVTMENVPGLIKKDVFKDFLSDLLSQGYKVDYKIVSCAEYGLPQSRQRLVLIGSRSKNIKILPPKAFSKSSRKSVNDVIGKLPPIGAGEKCCKDPLHQSAGLTEINLRRIRASRPGGTWKDWPVDLISNCHKSLTGRTYVSVYGRMKGDEPSPTITTQFYGFGNGRFGHPSQDRALSLREGAILQGFPKNYKFVEPGRPMAMSVVGRLIGNAVPVGLGKLIGMSLMKSVEGG